jgi:hypothetical protein
LQKNEIQKLKPKLYKLTGTKIMFKLYNNENYNSGKDSLLSASVPKLNSMSTPMQRK